MSRIGKKPISLPSGVAVTIENNVVKVKGPKGELQTPSVPHISMMIEGQTVTFTRDSEEKDLRALHGLMRALVNNMIIGVTEGYKKQLEIKGIGYRAALQGDEIVLNIGYSHPVKVKAPAGIKFTLPDQLNIIVEGIDKQLVGQVAANIRQVRKPEPYKGKGIRYTGEIIKMKAGKAKAKGG